MKTEDALCQVIGCLIISPALKRFLLYVRRSEIRGVDIDDPYMNVMTALTVPDIDDVTVVDYDSQEERIYWADIKTQTIKRAFINGTQLETVISLGESIPDVSKWKDTLKVFVLFTRLNTFIRQAVLKTRKHKYLRKHVYKDNDELTSVFRGVKIPFKHFSVQECK